MQKGSAVSGCPRFRFKKITVTIGAVGGYFLLLFISLRILCKPRRLPESGKALPNIPLATLPPFLTSEGEINQ